MVYTKRSKFLLVVLTLALSSCATYHQTSTLLYDHLKQGDSVSALSYIESQPKHAKNTVLYNLNRGLLLQMQSRYQESNQAFGLAKEEMQRLEATSIVENLGSLTVNEGRRSYPGQPYERLLLHTYMAINYLMLDNLVGARVEVMQADLKMQEWLSSKKEIEGIKSSAFTRYFSGIVFEINKESDNALIAYRKAYQAYKSTDMAIPQVLKSDLLRLTKHFGLTVEYNQYKKAFELVEEKVEQDTAANSAELIYIANHGVLTPLMEQSINSFSGDLEKYIRIAVPFYPPLSRAADRSGSHLYIDKQSYQGDIIESIDQLARENLKKRMPAITARAVARAAVKYKLVDEAGDEHPLLGLIGNVATVVSESADTRSWSVLPGQVEIMRKKLPPGPHTLGFSAGAEVMGIEVKAGEKVVLISYPNTSRFHIARY